MTDLEEPERELLLRARRGLGPTSEDEHRIWAATLAAMAPAPDVSGSSSLSEGGAGPAAAAGTTAAVRWVLSALALGVAGAAGYGWGYRAGVAVRPAPAVAAAVLPAGPSNAPPPLREGASNAGAAPPAARTHSAEAESKTMSKPPAASTLRATAALGADVGLDEEVRQLRRIERAIRDGNPRLALVLADELERAVPRGQLATERSAAVMMASCQLDAPRAREKASHFVQQNPASAFVPRLREMCGLSSEQERK